MVCLVNLGLIRLLSLSDTTHKKVLYYTGVQGVQRPPPHLQKISRLSHGAQWIEHTKLHIISKFKQKLWREFFLGGFEGAKSVL